MSLENLSEAGKLNRLDYFQIATSDLFVILGLIILVRSLSLVFTPLMLIVSLGFVLLGLFRLVKVLQFFRRQKK
jgi:hypothetical protein